MTNEDFEKFATLEPDIRHALVTLCSDILRLTDPNHDRWSVCLLTSQVTLLLQKVLSWTDIITFVLGADNYLKEKEKAEVKTSDQTQATPRAEISS